MPAPGSCRGDENEAEIALGVLVVSCCRPAEVLEFVEAALDHVPEGVDGGVDGVLCLLGSDAWN